MTLVSTGKLSGNSRSESSIADPNMTWTVISRSGTSKYAGIQIFRISNKTYIPSRCEEVQQQHYQETWPHQQEHSPRSCFASTPIEDVHLHHCINATHTIVQNQRRDLPNTLHSNTTQQSELDWNRCAHSWFTQQSNLWSQTVHTMSQFIFNMLWSIQGI